jgi:hypothetical protein
VKILSALSQNHLNFVFYNQLSAIRIAPDFEKTEVHQLHNNPTPERSRQSPRSDRTDNYPDRKRTLWKHPLNR